MKNADDPYKGLLKIFQSAASVSLQATAVIGEIIEPPPNIKISYNGMTLNAQYLWIDEYWLQGHTRHAKGHIVSCTQPRAGGGGDAAYASHNHDIDNDYVNRVSVEVMGKPINLGEDLVKQALNPLRNVKSRTVIGGCAPEAVNDAIEKMEIFLNE